jgi:hypothetical protein
MTYQFILLKILHIQMDPRIFCVLNFQFELTCLGKYFTGIKEVCFLKNEKQKLGLHG